MVLEGVSMLSCMQGFPTMVTPTRCSDVLRAWIEALTVEDCERLWSWGISTKFLSIANVEVSRYLLCAAARFWKPAFHVFHFGQVEMTPTLEEVRRICSLSREACNLYTA